MTKARYEKLVKHSAHHCARKAGRKIATPGDYAQAKTRIDAKLAQRGVNITGDHLLGTSDIMGAAYVLGEVARGSVPARRAIVKTVRAAKAGSPSAKKQVKALTLAKAAATTMARPKRQWLSFGHNYYKPKTA